MSDGARTTPADEAISLAIAAISVAEALMILLIEKDVLAKDDVEATLQAAIDSHRNAEPARMTLEQHQAAAEFIRKLMTGANSVRPSAHI